jgi:predicted house-cleaning noncanonical NTP pyrophosphatase (MazG superfamily)
MSTYNNLVRDKIPEKIEASGGKPNFEILDQAQAQSALLNKLHEQIAGFVDSLAPEDLAEVLEVLYAFAESFGYSREQIEQMRLEKHDKEGGYTNYYCLADEQKTK